MSSAADIRQFVARTAVSRETLARLEAYAGLLLKWQDKINLIGPATVPELWRRHMLDSAQLWPLVPEEAGVLVDIGSGAGFPGLVLAILAAGAGRDLAVHLVESDGRKAVFLREAARAANVAVTVHPTRIERLKLGPVADVVTARALAPVDKLCTYAAPLLKQNGRCLFLKGRKAEGELTLCRKHWKISAAWVPSISDRSGAVLVISSLETLK